MGGGGIGTALGAVGGIAGAMSGRRAARDQRAQINQNIQSQRLRDDQFTRAATAANAAAGRSADEAVAGFSGDQLTAQQLIRDNYGLGNAELDGAIGNAQRTAMGRGPRAAVAQSAALNPAQFANPWESQVVQAALGDIDLMRRRRGAEIVSEAEAAGAWGGDRAQVARALSDEGFDRTAAATSAGLRSDGFRYANDAAMAEAARADQMVDANARRVQQSRQFGAGLRMEGNSQLARLIAQRRGQTAEDTAALAASGADQQGLDQFTRDWAIRSAGIVGSVPGIGPAGQTPVQPVPSSTSGAIAGFMGGSQMGSDLGALLARYRQGASPGGYGTPPFAPPPVTLRDFNVDMRDLPSFPTIRGL